MRPYTDKAKKAMNYANRLSKSMNCNYVGSEHILAGLLKEGTGVAAEVLTANNIQLDNLLQLIQDLVAAGEKKLKYLTEIDTPRARRQSLIVHLRWQNVLDVRRSEQNIYFLQL